MAAFPIDCLCEEAGTDGSVAAVAVAEYLGKDRERIGQQRIHEFIEQDTCAAVGERLENDPEILMRIGLGGLERGPRGRRMVGVVAHDGGAVPHTADVEAAFRTGE